MLQACNTCGGKGTFPNGRPCKSCGGRGTRRATFVEDPDTHDLLRALEDLRFRVVAGRLRPTATIH